MPSPREAVRLVASRWADADLRVADPASTPVPDSLTAASSRAGYTLAEVLIVTAIVGVVIGMTATRINTAQLKVDGASQQVSSTLMMAQRTSLSKQHNVVVSLDTANGYMRVHFDKDNDGVLDSGENTSTLQLEPNVVFGRGSVTPMWFGDKSTSFVKKQGGSPAITFNRDGSASERGGLYISSARAIGSASYSKEARAVVIERYSGRVSRYRYNGTGWQKS